MSMFPSPFLYLEPATHRFASSASSGLIGSACGTLLFPAAGRWSLFSAAFHPPPACRVLVSCFTCLVPGRANGVTRGLFLSLVVWKHLDRDWTFPFACRLSPHIHFLPWPELTHWTYRI